MRGFRWQFLALAFALVVFGVTYFTRPVPAPPPVPTPVPTSTEAPIATPTPIASPTQTIEPGVLPTSTPMALSTPDNIPLALPTFREGVVGEVTRLNPLLAPRNDAEQTITSLIFEGLVRTNIYGEPEPALARRWVIANNQIEYVFELREDVLWQDGTPFTARDVAFTTGLLRSPDFPGNPALAEFWRTVEVQVLGDYLVRFRLAQPFGGFLDVMRVGILPEHALRGTRAADLASHPFNLAPVGTGPYQLEALRTDDDARITTVDLVAAPVYIQRTTAEFPLRRMRFRVFSSFDDALFAFNNGELDGLAALDATQRSALLSSPVARVYTKLEPTLGVLIFNYRVPQEENAPPNPFREERVRDALMLGMDQRDAVERSLLEQAVPANGPLLPGLWAYSPSSMLSTNPEEAVALLEAANLPTADTEDAESDAPLLSFSILVPNQPALVTLAEEVAGQWGRLGLEVTVEAEDTAAYRERLELGDFDVALVELSLGTSADPDVYNFWHQGQFPDGRNYGALDDRQISETLERARRDPFGLNRAEHYRQFQRIFMDKTAAIPLYHPLFTYAVSERVQGVQIGFIGQPSDRLRTIAGWSLAE